MPFITEELWARLVEVGVERASLLCLSSWPVFEGLADAQADEEIGWIVKLVSEVRSVRSEMNVPAGAKIPLVLVGANKATRARAEIHEDTIERLARIDSISFAKAPPPGSAQIVLGEATAALPLAGVIDMDAERTRLAREIGKVRAEIQKVDAKLANASFVAKAPPEVVEENRERRAAFEATLAKLQAALKRVEAAS
jgi:valyl-tRNA synthetase